MFVSSAPRADQHKLSPRWSGPAKVVSLQGDQHVLLRLTDRVPGSRRDYIVHRTHCRRVNEADRPAMPGDVIDTDLLEELVLPPSLSEPDYALLTDVEEEADRVMRGEQHVTPRRQGIYTPEDTPPASDPEIDPPPGVSPESPAERLAPNLHDPSGPLPEQGHPAPVGPAAPPPIADDPVPPQGQADLPEGSIVESLTSRPWKPPRDEVGPVSPPVSPPATPPPRYPPRQRRPPARYSP